MFGFCEICKEYNDLLDKHHIMSRRYGGTNKNVIYVIYVKIVIEKYI